MNDRSAPPRKRARAAAGRRAGDKVAVVWTRATGEPRKLGLLVLTRDQVRFTYEPDAGDLPGISVIHNVPALIGNTQTWSVTEANPLPPMFQALIPPRPGPQDPPNLQRLLLSRILEREGLDKDGDPDWQMLLLAGRNAIGHLDVFRDDTDATDFYAAARPIIPAPLEGSPLWDLAYNALNASVEPMTLEAVIDAIGVRPTAGGAMPKMLLPIISPDGGAPVDALVKFNDREYEDLLVMEKIGYDVFERLGERTPRCWIGKSKEGRVVLATERFDRVNGLPVPLESLFSTMFVASRGGISARWSEHTTTPNFEMVGAFMRDERVRLTVDPATDATRFYRRIVANVLIGNSDMHLENFGFLGGRGATRLSPVYDPAPMRGYESKCCVSMVSFGGLITSDKALPNAVGDGLLKLHHAFGLQQRSALDIIEQCLVETADFPDLIRGTGAKRYVADRLLSRLEGTRYRIEQAARALRPQIQVARPKPQEPPADDNTIADDDGGTAFRS